MKPSILTAWLSVITLVASQALAQTKPAPAPAAPPAATPPAAAPAPAAPVTPAKPLSESLAGEAKAEYEAGKLLYEDGDYAGSSLKFQRAYELSKDPRLLWNRAAAEKNLRHYVIVKELVQQYLKESSGYITDMDRADAEALIETVSAFVAKLNVTVNQPGASISVNGKPVGKSPLTEPVMVDMGQHEIKVELAGFKPFSRMVQVAGGGTTAVDFTLEADKHEGILRIIVGHDAMIRVDGKMVGMGQWQGTLPSGVHTVEVSAKGKQTYVGEGLVQDNQTATMRVNLQNEPAKAAPAAGSGVPTWLWVGGAAVLAVGAGVGGYFLFKPEDKGPPAPVEGSLGTVELPLRRRF
jgi:hypothetical protein